MRRVRTCIHSRGMIVSEARELQGSTVWRCFNAASDEMAKNHRWDYANTPEAT